MSELRAGSATDVGRVRSVNQDMVLDRPNLYAVADGMGGHAGGEVAARLAVETLEAAFGRWPTSVGLREAVEEANVAVWRESQVHPDLHGMGTTLTALAVVDESGGQATLALANVGDSRAYLFSRGALTQITFDHSLAEERVRLGEMTEAEAAVHPQRHILTRALGVSADVQVDVWELGAPRGTRVLLCSDGLSNEVGPEEIAAILERETDPAEAARSLVEVANEHGGADNITVVVVDVLSGDETSSAGIVLVPAVEATGDTVPPPPPPPAPPGPPPCLRARCGPTTPSRWARTSSSDPARRRSPRPSRAATSSSSARPVRCRCRARRRGFHHHHHYHPPPPARPRRRPAVSAAAGWASRDASRPG